MSRWSGHGNTEFKRNVVDAFQKRSRVRLVIAKTSETTYVDSGKDASLVKKEFFTREDLIGEVAELNGDNFFSVSENCKSGRAGATRAA